VKHSSATEGSREKSEAQRVGWYFQKSRIMGGQDVSMPAQYRIGEFAALSGVSAKTLRFYDEIGLLRPASIDARTRYRLYLPQQLEELASILALKEMGVPLAMVRKLIGKAGSGTGPAKDRRAILNDLKRTLELSIHTANQSLQWINAALNELDDSTRPIPVVVKRRQPVLIASIRSRLDSYGEIARLEKELSDALPSHAVGDLRGVLWHRCADSGQFEGEAFVGLRDRVARRSVYDLKQLPAATLACAYSDWDDDRSEQTYRAIAKWMNVRGYRLAGPKREIYLNQMLAIEFPLKSA
jgi:DNA-binding transcriptional MerR regulator